MLLGHLAPPLPQADIRVSGPEEEACERKEEEGGEIAVPVAQAAAADGDEEHCGGIGRVVFYVERGRRRGA